jgi:Protein of unknown function (DUF1475)
VIIALRFLFTVVLLSMLWVTTWAGLQCPLFAVPRAVATHPWFIATMFDAYWGFTTFFVWVCFKQVSWTARIAWFVAIMALGNIAMSSYWLSELYGVRPDGKVADLLTARRTGPGWLGIALAVAGIAVTVAAALAAGTAR